LLQSRIGITSDAGLEVLVHMGLDTVEMNGTPFETKVAAGDQVKAGDLLSTVDVAAIQASDRDAAIVVIFTNMDKVKDFSPIKAGPVTHGDAVTTLTYAG
ncbi:PTS glucose transporter subunit IIA, partial [Lacticaseibacillus paracasei]|uniref:PTS sugar transporter subunit IIA n=1 Tax=Lacticaseibacillus paracasei TaxID=1597 RepID=UPI00097765A7